MIEFRLPDLGENITAGDVVKVLVAPGDIIAAGQNVLELETDKAVVELPCPHAGKVVQIHVRAGDRIPVGAPILTIDETPQPMRTPAGTSGAPPAPLAEERPSARVEGPTGSPAVQTTVMGRSMTPEAERTVQSPGGGQLAQALARPSPPPEPPELARATREAPGLHVPASPAVRRFARELGVDLRAVEGTGPGGRITEDDVKAYIRQLTAAGRSGPIAPVSSTPPLPDFARWGPVQRRPLRGIRRKTAENVSLSWQMVPHVTQFDLADVTELEAARKAYVSRRRDEYARARQAAGDQEPGPPPPPLTMTVLVMKAVAKLLPQYPQFNSSLDPVSGELIVKQYYHIGVAVDTEHGLIVPVVRDVDRKGILQLAREVDDLARRARDRKVDIEELRGGTFTVSNLGGLGGTGFTPIVNYPEVAILGIARSREEPVVVDGRPSTRVMLPLCLSYDHRVIDGADGVRFLRALAGILADPLDLLLGASGSA